MKIVPMLLIICSLTAGISSIGTGCEDPPPPGDVGSTSQEKWTTLVNLRKESYDLLSVEESQHWLEENADMTDHQKALQGIAIDVDPNGNRRVFKRRRPAGRDPGPMTTEEGWLTAEESETWLRNNHYQVQKKADGSGYTITYKFFYKGVNHEGTVKVSSGSIVIPGHSIPHGYVNIDKTGRLRVKASGIR